MNKKGINNAVKYEADSSSEGISSDHIIVQAKIRPSLQRNKKLVLRYDWSSRK